jgi:photosystem II protein PsbQ
MSAVKIWVRFCLICWVLLVWAIPVYAQTTDYTSVYAGRITQLSDRLAVLQEYVDSNNWVNIRTYIHGPLGEVRRDIAYLTRGLTGSAKQKASTLGKVIADDLVKLDFAAKNTDAKAVQSAFLQVTQHFDQLLALLPKSPKS